MTTQQRIFRVGDRVRFRRGGQVLTGIILGMDDDSHRPDMRMVIMRTRVKDWLGQTHVGGTNVPYSAILGLDGEPLPEVLIPPQESEEARITRVATALGLFTAFRYYASRRDPECITASVVVYRDAGHRAAPVSIGTLAKLEALSDEALIAHIRARVYGGGQ